MVMCGWVSSTQRSGTAGWAASGAPQRAGAMSSGMAASTKCPTQVLHATRVEWHYTPLALVGTAATITPTFDLQRQQRAILRQRHT